MEVLSQLDTKPSKNRRHQIDCPEAMDARRSRHRISRRHKPALPDGSGIGTMMHGALV